MPSERRRRLHGFVRSPTDASSKHKNRGVFFYLGTIVWIYRKVSPIQPVTHLSEYAVAVGPVFQELSISVDGVSGVAPPPRSHADFKPIRQLILQRRFGLEAAAIPFCRIISKREVMRVLRPLRRRRQRDLARPFQPIGHIDVDDRADAE